MRSFFACLCLAFAGLLSVVANASTGIWENGYTIYRGDIDGDGLEDLYFEYQRPIILLHGEVVTPIALAELPNFVLYGTMINGELSYSSPVAMTLAELMVSTLEPMADNLSLSGDFNGDDAGDLLVLGTVPLILHASSTNNGNDLPSLAQTFPLSSNPTEIAVILSGADPESVTIEDVDGDGRDDIVVKGVVDTTLLASASGTFDSHGGPLVTNNSNMAGASAGQFRVNESGAATYSVPIASAAGTAGVAPQISLNYSGNGGNGLLGKGWSIGGLSSIARCRQTLAIDGQVWPITWTESDRFCLDGQRLIKVSGAEYGAVGAIYKTEMDSFAKITSVSGSLGKPAYFTVERKDGSISYYGNRSDAKLQAGSDTLVWAQNRFEDSVGNPIEFFYEGDANSGHRIEEIRYAYAGSSYGAEIEFEYETRTDILRGYTAGFEFKTTKRLKKVFPGQMAMSFAAMLLVTSRWVVRP